MLGELDRLYRNEWPLRREPQGAAAVVTGVRSAWRAFSAVSQLGFVTVVLGAFADALAHTVGPPAPVGSFTPPQQAGHLVVLIGMVITLAGILIPASRRHIRRPSSSHPL